MACILQSWDWLEDWKSKDNEMSRRVWKTVETKVGKTKIVEVEGRRNKKKKKRIIEVKKGSRRMKDLGQKGRSSEVRIRCQEISFSKVPQVDSYFQKESK